MLVVVPEFFSAGAVLFLKKQFHLFWFLVLLWFPRPPYKDMPQCFYTEKCVGDGRVRKWLLSESNLIPRYSANFGDLRVYFVLPTSSVCEVEQ